MNREKIISSLDKLEGLFADRIQKFENRGQIDDPWLDYCDRHKIILFSPSEVCDHFNLDSEDHVCLDNPDDKDDDFMWILVPLAFAEKALTLGLP